MNVLWKRWVPSRLAAGWVLAGLIAGTGCASRQADAPLPSFTLDGSRTTVSGLSSGAYMATQVHMAFSDHIAGVAMIAGGPYGCAQGSLETALSSCLKPAQDKLPDVDALAEMVKSRAASGAIAPLSGLAGDKVFAMHGTLDQTVAATISEDSAEIYRKLGGAIVEEDMARETAHTFPTESTGLECTTSAEPYLGKCGFDGAGEILARLYSDSPTVAPTAQGELLRFDQNTYLPQGKDALLADTGYLYVPKACAAGETCGLHIALHGCQQNAAAVGEAFVRDAGYNRWADARHLIVLYPQTRASYAPLNPKACWDWWGFSGTNYDTRQGVQMRWMANVAAALGAPLE
ncbi:MAG TPA: PHB depolymerase family esterase [Dokdonella sp.]|uniref:extracellular catalytic domain type 2 short-chain-length polyhydroxyalkanoate depolymerase n=1 Tax=Dokdonella sp. TaxID=2291710 RepID=UPI002D7FFE5D|nr:PHB depolymerase family esterase [Dokdonella sp.]HET9032570.1 PHB depolymerase family esterase [Dokdonella sp.]